MAEPTLPRRARLHGAGGAAVAAAGPRRFSMKTPGLAAVLILAAAGARPQPAGETPAAREQARRCERLDGESGIEACRAALALGLGPRRQIAVRELLANHLVDLERWNELAEHYREGVRLDPDDADVWFRLGSTLLFALNQKAEALAALEEATRLAPADASTRSVLAIALHALGRYQEAAASFDEALQLDPAVLAGRPAAQALREAALRGEPWP